MIDATLYQVGRNARTQDFENDHRRAQDEEQQMRDYKISGQARQQEDCRWNQVRPETIYPLPPIAGKPSTMAMIRVRLRSATARTPASITSENKPDTISSPPCSSSTKGAAMKRRPSATKSCTVEKRRNL